MQKALAHKLYPLCLAQGRKAELYRTFDLTDNVQTRFEFITAHLWLVMRKLKQSQSQMTSKHLAALFFADMDASLREAGEGDLAVPRRMKTFAQAFYGRLDAYDRALGEDVLTQALARNISAHRGLSTYFARQIEHLDKINLANAPKILDLFDQNAP